MPDLTQTPASVKPGSGAQRQTGVAGEAITAGGPVFKDAVSGSATNGQLLHSDANVATRAIVHGIALNSAALGQAVVYQTAGEIDLGATLVVGNLLIASANPGKIAPSADAIAGWRVIVLGVALAANRCKLHLWDTTATV